MPADRPNIVILMSDQHHADYLGCGRNPTVDTPTLDALAARGTRFTRAHCAFPLCGPSRMAFMTGCHPHVTQCLTNQTQLRSDWPTFAHALSAAGYETAIAGRMHFSGFDQRHGYDRRLIPDAPPTSYLTRTGESIWSLDRVLSPDFWHATGAHRRVLELSGPGETGYLAYDRQVARTAAAFLEQRGRDDRRDPFLLTVGFISPHCPFICEPDDFYTYYRQIGVDDLPEPALERLNPLDRAIRRQQQLHDPEEVPLETQRVARAAYHGLCAFTDRQVGIVLAALDRAGLADNTLVLYTSDHGEQAGEHGLWWKMSFYRGAEAVPLIVAGPGVGEHQTLDHNVSLIDIGPTLLDHAGAAPLPAVQGRSFAELLRSGHDLDWPDESFIEYAHWTADIPAQRAVCRGPWKLAHRTGHGVELFHMRDDPEEMHNRASDPELAGLVAELTDRVLDGWNPRQVSEQARTWLTRQQITDQWVLKNDPPEPFAPWFDRPPINRLDRIPGSSHQPALATPPPRR